MVINLKCITSKAGDKCNIESITPIPFIDHYSNHIQIHHHHHPKSKSYTNTKSKWTNSFEATTSKP